MASYSVQFLSGGAGDGGPIPVAATSSPGTTIHTAVSGTSGYDEIYLYAANVTGTSATLTIEWGGTTDPDDRIVKGYSIPANSALLLIVPGLRLNNGSVVKAYSGTAGAINISGNVNRIT